MINILFVFSLFIFEPGVAGSEFLNLSFGPRPMSMGGAFTGLSDDLNAIFYNPAGMGFYKKGGLNLAFMNLYQDVNLFNGSASFWTSRYGSFSTGVIFLSAKDIGRDDMGFETGEFVINDISIEGAYSYPIRDKLSFGAGIKVIYSRIEKYSSFTRALDVGVMFHPFSFFYSGISLKNFGAGQKFYKKEDYLPTKLSFGSALKIPVKLATFILSSDIKTGVGLPPVFSIGSELGFEIPPSLREKIFNSRQFSGIYLRGGYESGDRFGKIPGLTFGLGLKFSLIENLVHLLLDVVYLDYGYIGGIEQISLAIVFDKLKKK